MTMHRYHPDPKRPDDDPNAVLYDDCPRCDQHATNLTSLDNGNLRSLWNEMLKVELNPDHRDHYRNHTEAKACRNLYTMYVIMQRIGDEIIRQANA